MINIYSDLYKRGFEGTDNGLRIPQMDVGDRVMLPEKGEYDLTPISDVPIDLENLDYYAPKWNNIPCANFMDELNKFKLSYNDIYMKYVEGVGNNPSLFQIFQDWYDNQIKKAQLVYNNNCLNEAPKEVDEDEDVEVKPKSTMFQPPILTTPKPITSLFPVGGDGGGGGGEKNCECPNQNISNLGLILLGLGTLTLVLGIKYRKAFKPSGSKY